MILKFRDWEFEVDQELTKQTYQKVFDSGADTCICSDCKNYVAYRSHVFPYEVKQLFSDLGIDYKKEVEIMSFGRASNGLHHITGWFHFKGQVLAGKDSRIPLPEGKGFALDLTKINDNFSIGFSEGDDLTLFENKDCLIQVKFDTNIPWVINKELETQ